jgi:hypothetical protein
MNKGKQDGKKNIQMNGIKYEGGRQEKMEGRQIIRNKHE